MKVTLESTTKVVWLDDEGSQMLARIWEGTTANGVKVHAYITRIAVAVEDDRAEFEADLASCREPSAEVAAIPNRLIL